MSTVCQTVGQGRGEGETETNMTNANKTLALCYDLIGGSSFNLLEAWEVSFLVTAVLEIWRLGTKVR